MKKYIYFAVAGILALSACSKIDDTQNAPRQMTFTAGYNEGGETRATLNVSTKKVSFDANDRISILSAKNTNKQFTTTAGGASATFSGTATDDAKFYAVYPYQSGLTLDGNVIKNVQIPEVQSISSDAPWDKNATIAWATTTGSSLRFHNACALLKIHNDVGHDIIINIMCNGVLTGKFNLDTSTNPATLVQAGEGSESISIFNVPRDKTIYLAIAPGTVEDLEAMWIFPSLYQQGQKSKWGEVTFVAGKIYDLGKLSDWPRVSTP